MRKSGAAQTERSLGRWSTCSYLSACLCLPSNTSRVCADLILSGQWSEEEFWRHYGQFKISSEFWQKSNKLLRTILIERNGELF